MRTSMPHPDQENQEHIPPALAPEVLHLHLLELQILLNSFQNEGLGDDERN